MNNEPDLKKYEIQAMNLGLNWVLSESPRQTKEFEDDTFLSKPNDT